MLPTLKLLRRADDGDALVERPFDKELLTVGRGSDRDICIDDPSRVVSKNHCEIFRRGNAILLRDTSFNGVCINDSDDRIPRGDTVLIASGDRLSIGDFILQVGAQNENSPGKKGVAGGNENADRFEAPLLSDEPAHDQTITVPTDWDGAASGDKSGKKTKPKTSTPQSSKVSDEKLLEAFFDGAELDSAALKDDDPEKILYAVGVIYKQTVLSLSDILNDRQYLKNEFNLERTMMGAHNNSPLKFSGAQAAAIALLQTPKDGFLGGQDAIQEAGRDIKKHQLALIAAMRETMKSMADALDPSPILAQVKENKAGKSAKEGAAQIAEAWNEYERQYGEIMEGASTDRNSNLNKQFRKAYETHMAMLDSLL